MVLRAFPILNLTFATPRHCCTLLASVTLFCKSTFAARSMPMQHPSLQHCLFNTFVQDVAYLHSLKFQFCYNTLQEDVASKSQNTVLHLASTLLVKLQRYTSASNQCLVLASQPFSCGCRYKDKIDKTAKLGNHERIKKKVNTRTKGNQKFWSSCKNEWKITRPVRIMLNSPRSTSKVVRWDAVNHH